jgi:hypothetical protein
MSFTIPSGLITLYNEAIDSILEFNGVDVKLIYPPLRQECPNCYSDNLTGKSAGVYRAGGPYPFTDYDVCPYCNGEFYRLIEQSDTLSMNIYWTPKEFIRVGPPIQINDGMIQTKSYMTDLPKILKADHLQVIGKISGYADWIYVRDGEPVPHGFKSTRYILQMWRRA